MDVDRLLNVEKRTGVKDTDIDDFLEKANAVQAAIKGMSDGSLRPEDVHVDGIDTPEEIERKERERKASEARKKKKDEELRQKRAKEEKEKWWTSAEWFKEHNVAETLDEVQASQHATISRIDRYAADYSRWDSWVDETPATLAENAAREEEEEKKKNEEFEKNNEEFCKNFVKDMQERKKANEKKQSSANVARLRGNNFFKKGNMGEALREYRESLKQLPFETKTLLNIAQVHIRRKEFDDALEFLSRTLFLNDQQAKPWSRQAFVYSELRRYPEALESCRRAKALEPDNADIDTQLEELQGRVSDMEEEVRLRAILKGAGESKNISGDVQPDSRDRPSSDSIPEHYAVVDRIAESIRIVFALDMGDSSRLTALQTLQSRVETLLGILQPKSQTNDSQRSSSEMCKELRLYMRVQQFDNITSTVTATKGDVTSVVSAPSSTNAIGLATTYLSKFITVNGVPSSATQRAYVTANCALLQVLLHICCSEKANCTQCYDSKFIQLLKDYVVGFCESKAIAAEEASHLTFVDTAIKLITEVYTLCNKTRSYFHSQLGLLASGYRTMLFQSGCVLVAPLDGSGEKSGILLGLCESALAFLKTVLFSTEGKKYIGEQLLGGNEKNVHSNMIFYVGFLGRVAHMLFSADKSKKSRARVTSVLELVVETLVGYSQFSIPPSGAPTAGNKVENFVELRNMFVQTYNIEALSALIDKPIPENINGTRYGAERAACFSVVESLLDAQTVCADWEGNVLAALMNITIDNSGVTSVSINSTSALPPPRNDTQEASLSMRDALCNLEMASAGSNKIVALALSAVTKSGTNYSVRKLGLLSRLVTNTKVQQLLVLADNYSRLCSLLVRCLRSLAASEGVPFLAEEDSPDKIEVLNTDELNYAVRIFATLAPLVTANKSSCEKLCALTVQEHVLEAIIAAVFPPPRSELGEYTANSVIQTPKLFVDNMKNNSIGNNSVRAVLIGNAARVLLGLANSTGCCEVIFGNRKLLGVEKFVCAMATCSDMRVRKNIAILLAKGCKFSPATRELVTRYRGVQMMIELQDKF